MRQPPSIDAWGGGGFRVAGVWRPGSLLVLNDQPADWAATRLADLTPEDFAPVFAAGGFGCGFPHHAEHCREQQE